MNTTRSMPPHACSISVAASDNAAASRTSSGRTPPRSGAIEAANACSDSARRADTATRAPFAPSAAARAAPMPVLAPTIQQRASGQRIMDGLSGISAALAKDEGNLAEPEAELREGRPIGHRALVEHPH